MSLELICRLFDVVAWKFFLEQPSTNLSSEKFKYASVLNNDFHQITYLQQKFFTEM